MGIEYRKLCEKNLNTFIEMRISQLREEGAKENIDLKPALSDYYMRHMKDSTFILPVIVILDNYRRDVLTLGENTTLTTPYIKMYNIYQ